MNTKTSVASTETTRRDEKTGRLDLDRIFKSDERYQIGAMLAIHEDARGPLCAPVSTWLIAMAQRTWPRFAGLRWFQKVNTKRRWSIVSYHHPARLCWSWALHVSFFCKGYGAWLKPFRYSSFHIRIPYLIEISWLRQKYDWMLSSNAKRRLEAAALYQPRSEREVEEMAA